MRTNCPNCGAPIEHYYNHRCPYCNTFLKNTDENIKDLSNYDLKFDHAIIESDPFFSAMVLKVICRAYPKCKMFAEGENMHSLYVTQDRDMIMDNRVGISVPIQYELLYKLKSFTYEYGKINMIQKILKDMLPIPFHSALEEVTDFMINYLRGENNVLTIFNSRFK